MKILHIEDEAFKHRKIVSAIERCGRHEISWAKNYEQAMEMLAEPYDLIITDMNYPLTEGAECDPAAGEKLLDAVSDTPVIVCSSINYKYPKAYGCIWYSDISDWETALGKLINGAV
jgi:PleD family two-component response regulator